jgi:hypothetical protein
LEILIFHSRSTHHFPHVGPTCFVLLECLIRDIFFALLLALSVSFSNHKPSLLSETARVARNLLVAPCKVVEEARRLLSLQSHSQARHLDLLFAQAVFKGQHRAWTRTTPPVNLVCRAPAPKEVVRQTRTISACLFSQKHEAVINQHPADRLVRSLATIRFGTAPCLSPTTGKPAQGSI